MALYKAPRRDMRFVFSELFAGESLCTLPAYQDATPDVLEAVLDEIAKLCEEVFFPLNRTGDEEGCHYADGVVTTPKGFKEAYRAFAEGGWTSLVCAPEHGGQGLPKMLNTLCDEMMCSANLSFGMYPGLSRGAYEAISTFGSDHLKATYLPKLVEGSWSGTMCLTEAGSGTDLGLIRTKAEPQEDGTYLLTGEKIFITAGEHDLTENIVHLVLARTPDAPEGIKGISLFLVPKFIPDTNGQRNTVKAASIEHKMGIKASATCVMTFTEAQGWLVGDLHKGMRGMFVMMNAARLMVGVQGLGLAEASYQGAVAYARERLQGRALSGPRHPELKADPIIVHPDVRRMLLTMRAYIEGGRAFAGWISHALDLAHAHPDPQARQEAQDLADLLTPIVKAFLTDMGFEVTNLGVQVFGGHGFIRENGMEQYVRDARIAQLYEGTNGIQALDLVGRKMGQHNGRLLRRFFHPVAEFLEAHKADAALAEFTEPLAKAFGRLQRATGYIAEKGLKDPEEAAAAATDYLRLFALTALAFLWARTAEIALGKDEEFYRAKLTTARFFTQRLLPQTSGLFSAIMAGKASMMEMAEEGF